jgi:predicted TIM-barrel fold metal-dependent hydrolase
MDSDGIYAQVLYPNVPGFGAGNFSRGDDPEYMLACLTAYNDFLTEWSAADPKRLLPVSALPFWDIEASIAEMLRCKAAGHRGIIFSNQPESFGQPPLGHRHWDRLWAAAQEANIPVNFHIASGVLVDSHPPYIDSIGEHSNFGRNGSNQFIGNNRTLVDLTFCGICHRFPRLNFVSVESGVGWIPFALESYDWQWQNTGVHREHPEYELLPSEYFKRQIYSCFWFERDSLVSAVEQLGVDNFLYESDFPHPSSMSPGPSEVALNPRAYIAETMKRFPASAVEKLLHGNAARLYGVE